MILKSSVFVVLLIVVCSGFSTRQTVADVIASDTFEYVDGTLFGQNGGIGWNSIWTGNGMDVINGQAVGNQFGNPPKFGSRSFVNPLTSTNLFVSVEITTTDFGIDDFFGAFTGSGVNNSQIQFGKFPGSNRFQVGNGGFSSGLIDILPGTTYHLIAAYAVVPGVDPDLLMLWIDPSPTDYFDVASLAHNADIFRTELITSPAGFVNVFTGIAGVRFDNLIISDDPTTVGLLAATPELLGDVNCDGFVNLLDISPFVTLISSGGYTFKADINQDGVVNLLDVAPFIALLSGP